MIHPYINSLDEMISYLRIDVLKIKYYFEWCPNTPDYLVVSEHIYINKKCNILFKKLAYNNPVTIFCAGEAETPDFNIFDYAVSFDSDLKNGDRHTQLPPPFVFFSGFMTINKIMIQNTVEAKSCLQKKNKFCNFLYSNGNAHPNRDKLFYLLSKYKRVDSLGKHLNNMGNKPTGYIGHCHDCIPLKSPYKFSIASENAIFNGYTSEKILTSLAANTVPVYWGNPRVVYDINPKAFVNCFDYDTFDDVIERVREIDNNDDLWCDIVSQPWQTCEQKKRSDKRMENYISFFDNIFFQDLDDAKRTPQGTHPQYYKNYFFKANAYQRSKCSIVMNKIKKYFE